MSTDEEINQHINAVLGFADTGAVPTDCLPQALTCAAVAILTKITEETCGHKKCLKAKTEGLKRLIDSFTEFMGQDLKGNTNAAEEHKTVN